MKQAAITSVECAAAAALSAVDDASISFVPPDARSTVSATPPFDACDWAGLAEPHARPPRNHYARPHGNLLEKYPFLEAD